MNDLFTQLKLAEIIHKGEPDTLEELKLGNEYFVLKEIKSRPLHQVVFWEPKQQQVEIAKACIKYGCNINKLDENGDTPLLVAIEHENLELVKFFIESGASITRKALFTLISSNGQPKNQEFLDFLRKYYLERFAEEHF